jgi:outer membrane protein assembly factor BamA
VTRIAGAATLNRRENPHYEIGDFRKEVRGRAERSFAPWFRIGGGVRLTNVDFAGTETTYNVPSLDVVVDTRTDPAFPRNAIHAIASIEQLRFDGGVDVTRTTTDVRGYVALVGSSVLALRALSVRSDDPLPPFEQPLLGGAQTLRGFDVGYRVGDSLAALSAEVRVPITSALSVGRSGIKGFVDAGTVYSSGAKLADQVFDRGVGVGAFTSWAVLRLGLDVAWPLTGPSNTPKWHFGLGVAF